MGGLPCYKVVINSQEAQNYLSHVEKMAQDVQDGNIDDFFYSEVHQIIAKLDAITKDSRAVFKQMENLLRQEMSEEKPQQG